MQLDIADSEDIVQATDVLACSCGELDILCKSTYVLAQTGVAFPHHPPLLAGVIVAPAGRVGSARGASHVQRT